MKRRALREIKKCFELLASEMNNGDMSRAENNGWSSDNMILLQLAIQGSVGNFPSVV